MEEIWNEAKEIWDKTKEILEERNRVNNTIVDGIELVLKSVKITFATKKVQ